MRVGVFPASLGARDMDVAVSLIQEQIVVVEMLELLIVQDIPEVHVVERAPRVPALLWDTVPKVVFL